MRKFGELESPFSAPNAGQHPKIENSKHQPKISHTIHDKRFITGVRRGWFFKPEPDQKIRAHGHKFPENKEHQEIVRKHDPDHGKSKKRKKGEVSWETFVSFHVSDRVKKDTASDACHHQEHQNG